MLQQLKMMQLQTTLKQQTEPVQVGVGQQEPLIVADEEVWEQKAN